MGVQQVFTFQQSLLNKNDFYIDGIPKKVNKKRIRFKTPTYIKSYTFFSKNPDTNEIQYLGDEKHIFRIKVLHQLYSIIYGYTETDIFCQDEKIQLAGLTIWPLETQAEITGSEMWSIKKRVKAHIKLLRLLRQGNTLQNAVIAAKGE